MSRIDEAKAKISQAVLMLNDLSRSGQDVDEITRRILSANVLLDMAKEEGVDPTGRPLDSPLILREGRELKLFAEGVADRYLRVSMGDDRIFNVACILVDEIKGETAEIKVDQEVQSVVLDIGDPVVATIPVGTSVKSEMRDGRQVVTLTGDGVNTPSIKVPDAPPTQAEAKDAGEKLMDNMGREIHSVTFDPRWQSIMIHANPPHIEVVTAGRPTNRIRFNPAPWTDEMIADAEAAKVKPSGLDEESYLKGQEAVACAMIREARNYIIDHPGEYEAATALLHRVELKDAVVDLWAEVFPDEPYPHGVYAADNVRRITKEVAEGADDA